MPNTLNHSPADISRYALVALGLGTHPDDGEDWPINATSERESPDNTITVYDTAGTSDGRTMTEGELQGHDGIQVRVRCTDERTGRRKMEAIQAALAETIRNTQVTVDDNLYLIHCFSRIDGIIPLGKERSPISSRRVFTNNAMVVITQLI